MTASIFNNEHDRVLEVSMDTTRKMEWIVKDNPQLEAELNDLDEGTRKLSPQVVSKLLDRIKDL